MEARGATDIEEVMARFGYGSCVGREHKHGELCMTFADGVHLDVMPGSVRLTRPDRKTVKAKDAAGLEKRFSRELAAR